MATDKTPLLHHGIKTSLPFTGDSALDTTATSTLLHTVFNCLNMLLGTGTLAVPFAVSSAGWIGLLVIVAVGALSAYTSFCIGAVMSISSAKSFNDVGRVTFGPAAGRVIAFLVNLELACALCLYNLIAGENLHKLYPEKTVSQWVVLTAIAVLPSAWLPRLSALSYVSAVGIASTMLLFSSIVFAVFEVVSTTGTFAVGTRILGEPQGISVCIGISLFSFAAHAVLPSLYSQMKKPDDFPKVISISFTLACVFYCIVGVLGYGAFGIATQEQVTINLPKGIVSSVCLLVIVLNPLSKWALNLMPIAHTIEEILGLKWEGLYFLLILVERTGLALMVLMVTLKLPFFGVITGLTGGVLCSFVSIMIPSLCYMKLYWKELNGWERLLNIVLQGLGLLVAIQSAYVGVIDICHKLKEAH